ncbi:TnsD family Tn7-like transposition protein [Bacillus sp. ISL-39]|uniref:TnsD family Tn7-like transposition protein n=1 Tax=Bacillus sp. ISL-39 TaxID=2819124 RepID=UPI001BE7327D|nr:TnsD family Tn7-like transposition protein [Bacillus sp. ISL-39]MBT2639380.1 TniQ family protein [Bacillus sp. ISL-39]
MIGYFPRPYKDEVIYSVVARYHHHMGNTSRLQTLKELFSSGKISVTTEYLSNLTSVSSKIAHFSKGYTEWNLFKYNTTIPLYYPFIEKKEPEFRLSNIYRSRKRKNDVPHKEQLHYCLDCLIEQVEELGEGYWNRWHQIPGIFVCINHKTPLLTNQTNIEKQKINGFVLPNHNNEGVNSSLKKLENIEKHIAVAEDVKHLFNLSSCFLKKEMYRKYLAILKIKGLAFPISQMRNKLSALLISTYGEEFLTLLNSNVKKHNWINRLFHEKKLFDIHPIRHCLIMRALSGSVEGFLEYSEQFEPFGKGPWICLNPLSDHYTEKVVKNVHVSTHNGNRRIQGDFICKCGYVYRLRQGEIDPQSIKYFSNRVMKKGELWEKNFYEMVSSGMNNAEIAEKTKLSIPTIRKIKKEGVDPIQNALVKKESQTKGWRKKKTKAYRILWNQALKDYPNYSRKELADLNRAAYAWLHQFDSAWLENKSPKSQKGYKKKEKQAYEKEDLAMLEQVKNIHNDWAKNEVIVGKLKRKSYSAFCDLLGKTTINKEKYPLTNHFVQAIQESVEEFQIRRIDITLSKNYSNIPVTKYRLTEKLGIRRSIKPLVESYLIERLEKHNDEVNKLGSQKGVIINGET